MAHSILGSWSCNPKAKSGVGGPRPWAQTTLGPSTAITES